MALISVGATPPPVGLDIGTDRVRAAQIRGSSAGWNLVSYGTASMPIGAAAEGEILDPIAVSLAIKDLWRRTGMRAKDVSVGVSNQKVIVRLIDLPFMTRDELTGAIQYQAQDYIPIPIEEAILDFKILGDYMTPADEHMMEVLLVAAQRDMISNVVSAVEQAGLRIAQIDVTGFALVRGLLGVKSDWFLKETQDPSEALAVVHISSGLTNIVVVERGIPKFTRVSSLAGAQLTQAIASALNISFDEAEALKIEVGLPSMNGSAPEEELPEQGAAAQNALERETGRLIAEVRRSLDYYLTQASGARTINRIYLTGGGSLLKNLPAYLEKGLQAEVVPGDPLSQVQLVPAVQEAVSADRFGCAAAIGLALGGAL